MLQRFLVKFEADHFSTSQQGISSCDCLTASDGTRDLGNTLGAGINLGISVPLTSIFSRGNVVP